MAADVLSPFHDVHIYDKQKGIGQKFLVAGQGGFNITNSLSGSELATKYTPEYFLKDALTAFDSLAVRDWLQEMGIGTFAGSSGRIFPEKGITPADVLKKIKKKLSLQGVEFHMKHSFTGFGGPAIISLQLIVTLIDRCSGGDSNENDGKCEETV